MNSAQNSTAPLIDVERDELIPVRTLAQERIGKRISPACLWRWVRQGVRGAKLEAVSLMGTWYSTRTAFGAFITAQTAAAMSGKSVSNSDPTIRTPEKIERLKKAGLMKSHPRA